MTKHKFFPFDQEGALETLDRFNEYTKFTNDWLARDLDNIKRNLAYPKKNYDPRKHAAEALLLYEARKLHWKMMLSKFNVPKKKAVSD